MGLIEKLKGKLANNNHDKPPTHNGMSIVNYNVFRPEPRFFEDWTHYAGEKRFSSEEAYFKYFDPKHKQLEAYWKERNLEEAERLALSMISEGDKVPVVFNILAMVYRKQKRLEEEVKLMQLAMQAQIDSGNVGMAHHEFFERMMHVEELIKKAKK
ncbi:hypothetical protein [uncultured Secundilactobacillus sp.]|uniref:hypothetical protein n=1 Tax=uncultured Secundilactobacillus sp. TaxID=2813935 RepID=UPI00258FBCBF|nr:hypothetical protein [uncultured Secundilactobacillus sp.]